MRERERYRERTETGSSRETLPSLFLVLTDSSAAAALCVCCAYSSMLSFAWCHCSEETAQVWMACSDIMIS